MVAPSRRDLQLHGKHTFSSRRLGFSEIVSAKLFHTFPFFVSCGGFPIQDVTRKVSHLAAFQSVSEHFQSAQHDPTGEETQETQKWWPQRGPEISGSMMIHIRKMSEDLSMDLSMDFWYTMVQYGTPGRTLRSLRCQMSGGFSAVSHRIHRYMLRPRESDSTEGSCRRCVAGRPPQTVHGVVFLLKNRLEIQCLVLVSQLSH